MLKPIPNTSGTGDWILRQPPSFNGKTAFVLNGAFYGAVVTLMAEAGFERASTIEDADVVVFIGGSDISPTLYGEPNVHAVGVDSTRDLFETQVFEKCKSLGKTMFGICRGAQFLHAMNGGKLWQDVNNHGGRSHNIIDIEFDVRVKATSIHHQMLQFKDDLTLVAVCEDQVATSFKDGTTTMTLHKGKGNSGIDELEIEAGAYDATRCFFVQGHPEIGDPEYRSWTMTKLQDFIREWDGDLRPVKEVIEGMAM